MPPWLEGVRGEQVKPLIQRDAPVVRVEAGHGTGKTFGLARRVVRLLYPSGLGALPTTVLVVAFNRVIAKQLQDDIGRELQAARYTGELPAIRTIHSLCFEALGEHRRILLPHERDAMNDLV